jgi:hypothetical protein
VNTIADIGHIDEVEATRSDSLLATCHLKVVNALTREMIVVLCFRIRPAGCGMRISDFKTRKLRDPTSTISQGSCAVIILTKIMPLDFSHYGGPSEEWLAVEKLLPATPLIDTTMNPAVLRNTANAGRVVEKAPLMKELAPLVKMTDYVILHAMAQQLKRGHTVPSPRTKQKNYRYTYSIMEADFSSGTWTLGTKSARE